MPRLDETRPFLPVNIALLTVSDTRDAAQDRSGNTLADLATTAGHRIAALPPSHGPGIWHPAILRSDNAHPSGV